MDAKKEVTKIVKKAGKEVGQAKDTATKEAKKIAKIAEREVEQMKKKLQDAEKKAVNYAKKNPHKAAAIAVGVGAAVGAVLTALIGKKKK